LALLSGAPPYDNKSESLTIPFSLLNSSARLKSSVVGGGELSGVEEALLEDAPQPFFFSLAQAPHEEM
jgi:hypothetical protein